MKRLLILLSLIVAGCSLSIPTLIVKKDITNEYEDHTAKLKDFMQQSTLEEQERQQQEREQRSNLALLVPATAAPISPPREEPKGSSLTAAEPIGLEIKSMVSISETASTSVFVVRDKANIKTQSLLDPNAEKETKQNLSTFEKPKTIEVTENQIVVGWLQENYKWLIVLLLLPLIVLVFKKLHTSSIS